MENGILKLESIRNKMTRFPELEKFINTINIDLVDYYFLKDNLNDWDKCVNAIVALKDKRNNWPTDKKVTNDLKDEAKDIRDSVKEEFKKVKELLNCTSDEAIADINFMYNILNKLKNIILEFSEKFYQKKREKNIMDFNDMEHLALKILVKKDEAGNVVKTEVAKKYEEKFEEIAIDEYQDSNLVQEYILTSVSKGNNVFMVGDVKQSIYKFRQARPQLFIEKYNKYCINSNNPSFQVEIVKFDSEQEMSTQISTEIMAGSGPDIISLSQKLPFEKLIESRSLMNIYDLLKDDNSSNAINLDDYNVNILNAGVYDNGLYIVPLFYGVDVLVSTEERLKNFDIKENNGFSLTYSNFSDVFENYFLNDEGYSFVSNELSDFLWFDYPMQLFCRFLNSYVDFENKAVYFDTDEFKDNLDVMMQMLTISQKNNTNELFDGLYINRSFPLMAGSYSYYQSINETPVVFRGLTKNKDVNSAHIQVGYAINNNTQLKEQALAFIKYTLSDEIQEIGATASGSLSFPVNMSVYDNAKLVAGSRTDDNNKIIGIDNDFMKAYIDIADNVNACTLYRDVSHSYYNDNVIGDIVDNYINKGISKDKFIRQLSAATEIYLTE